MPRSAISLQTILIIKIPGIMLDLEYSSRECFIIYNYYLSVIFLISILQSSAANTLHFIINNYHVRKIFLGEKSLAHLALLNTTPMCSFVLTFVCFLFCIGFNKLDELAESN